MPQGISALLAFDPDNDIDTNRENMTNAAKAVSTGQMTYAARNAEIDGKTISEGDFMALVDDKLLATDKDPDIIIKEMAENMCSKKSSFITIIYGSDVEEEKANSVGDVFQSHAKNAEINVVYGGQPVYSYIISVE